MLSVLLALLAFAVDVTETLASGDSNLPRRLVRKRPIEADNKLNPASRYTAEAGRALHSSSYLAEYASAAQTLGIDNSEMDSSRLALTDTMSPDLLSQVEDMIRSVASPEPHKSRTLRAIVSDELIPGLQTQHNAAESQVSSAIAVFGKCSGDALSKKEDIKINTEASVDEARKLHTSCREQEKARTSSKNSRCAMLDHMLAGVNAHRQIPAGRPRDKMVQYVKDMSQYFCPMEPNVSHMHSVCHKEEREQGSTSCQNDQANFEMEFCVWRTMLSDMCLALSTCYENSLAAYNALKSTTALLVKKLKVEFAALKKILCYLDVWLKDDNTDHADERQLNQCKGSAVDTAAMDVNFPCAPPATECSLAAVHNHPGTPGFQSKEYTDFRDYVNKVIPCLEVGHGLDGAHIVNWLVAKNYFPQANECALKKDETVDGIYVHSDDGDWVEYFRSGFLKSGCGGTCNGDNGVNLECHYTGMSKTVGEGKLRGVNTFAKTYLLANADKSTKLWLGSDDGIAVWLNGASIFENLNACRCYAERQDFVDVQLDKGINTLVVKVGENDGHFGFTAELDNADGLRSWIR